MDAHCRCEFETRDVDATIATMVAEPYVNHIPTTVGESSVVDEFILRFTHTTVMVHEHIYWDQASVLVQLGLLDAGGSRRRRRDCAQGARRLPAQQRIDETVSTGGIVLVALAIAVGLIGIVLPLLPGTLLVFAAIGCGRSSRTTRPRG